MEVLEVRIDAEERQAGPEEEQTEQVQLVPHRLDVLVQTLLETNVERVGDHLLRLMSKLH